MLRLQGGQVESLWDEVLPAGLRDLQADHPTPPAATLTAANWTPPSC